MTLLAPGELSEVRTESQPSAFASEFKLPAAFLSPIRSGGSELSVFRLSLAAAPTSRDMLSMLHTRSAAGSSPAAQSGGPVLQSGVGLGSAMVCTHEELRALDPRGGAGNAALLQWADVIARRLQRGAPGLGLGLG